MTSPLRMSGSGLTVPHGTGITGPLVNLMMGQQLIVCLLVMVHISTISHVIITG